MATTVLEELVTVLGYEIDDADLKKYSKNLATIRGGMNAFMLAAGAAGAALAVFTQQAASSNDTMFRFSKTVGDTFEDIQRFTFATEAMGGSVDDAMSSIQALERLASTAALGKGGGDLFGFLGITPTTEGRIKKGIPLFKEIADALSTIDDVQRRADLASQFGISPRSLLLLEQGSEGIAQLSSELDRIGFIVTEQQGEQIREFMQTLKEVETVIRGVGNQIVLRFAPQITKIADSFIEWAAANKELTGSGLDVWLDNLEKFVGPAKILLTIFALMFVGANLVSAAVLTAAGAFATLLDDFLKFRKGVGDTLFGKAIESAQGFVDRHPAAQRINELLGREGLLGAIDDQLFGGLINDTLRRSPSDSSSEVSARERLSGNTTNDIKIIIDGALNPRATARAVADALREIVRGEHEAVTVAPRT